ncbi:hypothetical protein FA13DRAFT_1740330, partial [Coprinellus micaceus]
WVFLVLDDRDAAIVYSTGWGQAGSGNEFNSTTTHTTTWERLQRIELLLGTKITVYGTIAGSLTRKPTSSYAINTGTATNFEGDPGLTAKYNQVFFDSPVLPAAEHTLTITNTGADAELFLDLFMVIPVDTPRMTTDVTMTMTASGLASSSGTTAGSSDGSSTGAAQKSSNTAAIVGGIIGALALLVLLVGGVMFYRKSRNRWQSTTAQLVNILLSIPFWIVILTTFTDNWNTKGASNAGGPPTPLAPQFQSAGWGQPQMAQHTGGSYTPYTEPQRQYANSTYTTGGYSQATPAQTICPSFDLYPAAPFDL